MNETLYKVTDSDGAIYEIAYFGPSIRCSIYRLRKDGSRGRELHVAHKRYFSLFNQWRRETNVL